MSVLVFLHAHPDDESSQTAGTMARAAAQGHRVIVIFATDGDHGTALQPGDGGEPAQLSVAQHRRREAEASARVLGIARVAWLGHQDSGMQGWAQNDAPEAFMRADPEVVAAAVAAILDEEDAEVLIGYDWHGGYGHPDHVMVHRVMLRAVERAARRPRLLEQSMNRTELRRWRTEALEAGIPASELMDPDGPADDGNGFGIEEEQLHWRVPLDEHELRLKREAMQCHDSQADVQSMLAMPTELFTRFFGSEHYREAALDQALRTAWPFD